MGYGVLECKNLKKQALIYAHSLNSKFLQYTNFL